MIEVGLMTKDAMDRAYKLRHTELRARALVDSAVVQAMRSNGEPDERDFREYAFDLATNATALLMQYIYEDDAELKALRIERDHYKKIAERGIMTTPPWIVLSDPPPTG